MWEFERVLCCPQCGRAADARVFGVCSGFGPEQLRCPRCTCIFPSGRTEWTHLSGAGRARFFIHSTVYFLLLSLTGGMISQLFFDIWRSRPKLAEHFTTGEVLPGVLLLGLLTVALQVHRVGSSLRRTRQAESPPVRAGLWNFQISVQNKVRALLALVVLLGGFGLMLVRFGVIRLG